MSTSTLSVSIKQLLAELRSAGDERTDEELLSRFVRSRDEDALAALVNRHASMVWGVCRRLLRNTQDAEDVFQATFLVLVRKASCVPGQAVPNWLYGVARQTAVRVLTTVAKRGHRETQVVNMPETAMTEVRNDDLQIVVDAELSRLPGHYRGVVILCDLEGMTRKEAARQLGIPEGSVASRLARARALLAKRLQQRGVMFSGSVAAVLSAGSASSAPPALVASTIKAAGLLAAGQATGVVSLKVAALTDGVVKVMFVSKLKAMFSVAMILGFLATGAIGLSYHSAAGQDDKKSTAEKPLEPIAKPNDEKEVPPAKKSESVDPIGHRDIGKPEMLEEAKEAFTAWGKEVNGLQAGLGLPPGAKRVYQHGETLTLLVRVRNVGKKAVTFEYIRQFLDENRPTVTDANGNVIDQSGTRMLGIHGPTEVTLKPGKEIVLETRMHGASGSRYVLLRESGDVSETKGWPLYVGNGKFGLQFERVIGNSSSGFLNNLDPVLSKLATGKLELEVKDSQEKTPVKQDMKLTVDLAKKLLAPAAGISNADFKELLKDPKSEALKSNSLSLVLLALRPPKDPDAASAKEAAKEFRILGNPVDMSKLIESTWISKGDGYASFIQPKYITECSCESTTERAEGIVAFENAHFAGRIPFVAEATKDGWIITEFRLPQYKTKVVRGKDGVWSQEKLEEEAFTAWGKEVAGLQAGIRLKSIDVLNAANQWEATQPVGKIHQGSVIRFEVIVRNVSKQDAMLKYIQPFGWPCAETGRELKFAPVYTGGKPISFEKTLQPGENWEVAQLNITTRKPTPTESFSGLSLLEVGKFRVGCPSVLSETKLATGELEIEILSPNRQAEK